MWEVWLIYIEHTGFIVKFSGLVTDLILNISYFMCVIWIINDTAVTCVKVEPVEVQKVIKEYSVLIFLYKKIKRKL